MGAVVKGIVRIVVVGGLVGGGAAFLAETVRPGSVRAMLHQSGHAVATAIDRNIDDPAALRAQLVQLQAEYPQRIAAVRADLGEVEDQISQVGRELAISEKVVALTTADLTQLNALVDRAHAAAEAGRGPIIRVAFEGRAIPIDEATARRNQVDQTRRSHEGRATDLQSEMGYLSDQREQLTTLLAKLELEQAEFQTKLFQIDAQIDSIARGERMIALIEDRQRSIDEHSRYQAASVDQLTQRLDRVRGEQKARLAAATTRSDARDYEREAAYLVETDAPTQPRNAATVQPTIIRGDSEGDEAGEHPGEAVVIDLPSMVSNN